MRSMSPLRCDELLHSLNMDVHLHGHKLTCMHLRKNACLHT